jgi:hypothetical protein
MASTTWRGLRMKTGAMDLLVSEKTGELLGDATRPPSTPGT